MNEEQAIGILHSLVEADGTDSERLALSYLIEHLEKPMRASYKGSISAPQAEGPGSSPGARLNPKGGK